VRFQPPGRLQCNVRRTQLILEFGHVLRVEGMLHLVVLLAFLVSLPIRGRTLLDGLKHGLAEGDYSKN
jgi:hypothetical protein